MEITTASLADWDLSSGRNSAGLTGYPQGLKGDEIILEARIAAVADVIESMASHRPYRPSLGIDAALAEIERGKGAAYDAQVVAACLRLFRDKGYVIPG